MDQKQIDAMMNFWRDAWTRTSGTGGASGGTMPPEAAGWMPSPEAVRRMQAAFLDAMAGSAEQYMRSPQFLESMRESLESAVELRTQMEEFLRKNMADSLRTPGDASAQVLAALTQMESRLSSRLDELSDRLDRVEMAPKRTAAKDAAKPTPTPKAKPTPKPTPKPKASARSASTGRGKSTRR